MKLFRFVPLALCFAAVTAAQPVVQSAANAASYLHNSLPNGGLAKGGMGVAIGSNLGSSPLTIVTAFPLQTVMAGTSVRITVGGQQINCFMIYTLPTQVAFIVPSNAPEGDGTLTVTFNGQTSAAFPVRIVRHAFGIFTLNQAGSGPGIFTDPNNVVNTLFATAPTNGTWVIWGTGLTPVSGNEADGPLPGDITDLDVVVLVGGRRARVVYRGRSGCCAGLDQIAFEIPEGVAGCYVPVVVIVNGVPSNYVTISISPSGGTCSDPNGLSAQQLTTAQTSGLRYGVVSLSGDSSQNALGTTNTDSASGNFFRYDATNIISATALTGVSTIGACSVYTTSGAAGATDPIRPAILDAGASLNVNGPNGARPVNRNPGGTYSAVLNTPAGAYLTQGNHTMSGTGGADVGAFNANVNVPARLVWTNRDAINGILTPPTVNWTGGDPNGFTTISGFSVANQGAYGAGFFCIERTSAASFTLPAEVFNSLPPSDLILGNPTGGLTVSGSGAPGSFTASGIDVGVASASFSSGKSVAWKREFAGGGGAGGITVTSPTIVEGGVIPAAHGCRAMPPQSPGLTWTAGPAGTQSYAMIMLDPDAGNFVHWIVYDIPGNVRTIPAGGVPAGAQVGRTTTGQNAYFPACPPSSENHRYTFRVVALSTASLGVAPAAATRTVIEAAMTGRIVGEGTLTGRFSLLP